MPTTPTTQASLRFVQLRRAGGAEGGSCTTGPKILGPIVDFRDDWSQPVRTAVTAGDVKAARRLYAERLRTRDERIDEAARLALAVLLRAAVDARLTVGQLRDAITAWATQREITAEQMRTAVAGLTGWAVDVLVLGLFLRLPKCPAGALLVRVLRGVTVLRLARSPAEETCLVRALLGGRDLVLPDPPTPNKPADPDAERADRFADLGRTVERLIARARASGRPDPTLADLSAGAFPDLGPAIEATTRAAAELGAAPAATLRAVRRVFDAEREDARRRLSRLSIAAPDVDLPDETIPDDIPTIPYVPPRVPVLDASARVAGRGDLMIIKTTHLRYEPSDISYIENVLASEVRGRTHVVDTSTSETVTTVSKTLAESTQELESTEQNSLDRALQTAASQQTSTSLGVSVSGGFGPVQAGIDVNADRSTSTETSMSSAVSYSKTLTEHASELLRSETAQRRTTTSTTRVTETNEHKFDNAAGAANIAGVYRWLDKIDQAQLYNYGERLLLEFVVSEPGTTLAWLASQAQYDATTQGAVPEPPGWFLEVEDLDDDNYAAKAARWDIFGVEPPPDPEIFATTTFVDPAARPFDYEKNATDKSQPVWGYTAYAGEVAVPGGYAASEAYVTVTWALEEGEYTAEDGSPPQAVQIAIGEDRITENDGSTGEVTVALDHVIPGPLPIGISADQRGGLTVVVRVRCERTAAAFAAWQLRTWETIRSGYLAQRSAYDNDQARRQARAAYTSNQPAAMNRAVEMLELKRACQTVLTGQEFDMYGSLDDPDEDPRIDRLELAAEADHIQFFEDVFDWPNLTYLCYPYQWAGRDRWAAVLSRTSSDPLHQAFLQAGAARVMVPVRAGYEHAVGEYLATSQVPTLSPRPWRGSNNPYPPIEDLIGDALDRPGEEVAVDEPWEVVTPTALIQLQTGTELNPPA